MDRQYLCIDLKSFYASVECVERGLDPMTTNLVVADPTRSDKTICLAVSPSMKALGVRNRCRVFEIPKHIDYIMATPRMQKYIDYAAMIYGIYLHYFAKEDIHVYSIDEAFIDVTDYLALYKRTPRALARGLMGQVLKRVGVRATCGVGTNLYLAKIALDVLAKHAPDFIGELDETQYRELLWDHRPLTDFWRIGPGIANRLAHIGVYTMRDLAMCPEDLVYRHFGVDAELLIDHAWGRESTTMADIKAYRSKTSCLSAGQVLMRDYSFQEARVVVKEMIDRLCLDMVKKDVITNSVSLYVGYSSSAGVPGSHGSTTVARAVNSDKLLRPAVDALYMRVANPFYPIRRLQLSCNHVETQGTVQLSLFDTLAEDEAETELQRTVLEITDRYGKNAVLKGMSFTEGATARERNLQIGGHKA